MSGIGKTTIAEAVYNKICNKFEASDFVPKVREKLKTSTVFDLQRRFVSRLLDQKIKDMVPLRFGNHFIKERLRQKKVLIVFDDVDSSEDLQELLLGHHDSFGPGSRILITSRDQHVLRPEVDATYEVEAMDDIEARQLFKSKAFKKTYPTAHHEYYLLQRMVKYAGGNPLALVVLGSALCDRSKEDWYSTFNRLGQIKKGEIQDVLKISYDGLEEEERDVFLDIASFLQGIWDRCTVTKMLEKKCPSVHYCISVLIDKSLITTSHDTLGIHDLLREMAHSIVIGDPKKPGKSRRLVDPEDISHVLKKRKVTKAVRGICLDMPESMEMQLKSDAFKGVGCLEFLIVKGNTFKVHLPRGGLECLPDMLKYLRWDGYPSKSLPQKFCAENIFQLDFPDSKLEKLWSGQQNLVYLRRIDLSKSEYLTELPDLSKANILQYVKLEYCISLIEVPSYFECFENLEYLSLRGCSNLKCFPRRIGSNIMKTLSLADCSTIKKCPEISADIEVLNLSRTAIKELQQSFSHERAQLYLSGCSNMTKFPEISGNLTVLYLDQTCIEEVPSSIQLLTNLEELRMDNCKQLSRLPSSICRLQSLKLLCLLGCSKLESVPAIMEAVEYLKALNLDETTIRDLLNGCSKLERFPEIKERMACLMELDLYGTAIRELPSSIRLLKSLVNLHLDCTPIKEQPELPPSLSLLTANDCESLEIILTSILSDSLWQLSFADCFKFDQKALMAEMQMKFQFGKVHKAGFGMALPGSEIPEWFSDQSMGSSITIQFPSNPRLTLKAVAFCLVVVDPYDPNDRYKLRDNMYICYRKTESADFSKFFGYEITFRFYPYVDVFTESCPTKKEKIESEIIRHLKVERCGIHLFFDENPDQPSISDEDE